jgi:hypothetical protein
MDMKIKLWGSLAVLTLGVVAACGDDTTSGTTSTTGTTTATTTTTTTTTGTGGSGGDGGAAACSLMGVADPGDDCALACAALYDCGALECDGADLCMFSGDAAEKTAFVGDDMGGCIMGCNENPALVNLVDVENCDTTISTLKGLNMGFAMACDNGISGSGGAGGAGGAGGGG